MHGPITPTRTSRNKGDGLGSFEDVTAQCGLNRAMLPMGANFGDINNDGYPDFYLERLDCFPISSTEIQSGAATSCSAPIS
jgi:hypothetical protein